MISFNECGHFRAIKNYLKAKPMQNQAPTRGLANVHSQVVKQNLI